ncbi:prepilin peptidase-dependent protein [Rosenbergiella australiborealis]|uniref:Prepilin peptidase-dependent protein n=1 Tax=Rosenbergiella australiborealis TaxID=1544696 RepID=A0ABS5T7L1_9GAMM|nr:prepilin peptidase-dependent protein [Rosenbergiella australiborealis]MBT0728351.1 prepilin peptidase-dependent protein [Rosenbergiella australiborealis]
MRRAYSAQAGFSMIEMVIALSIGAIVLLSAARLLPQLSVQLRALEQRQLLRQEVHRLILLLEKAIRRAGFCYGDGCQGLSLEIKENGKCLLTRWDDNAKGRWNEPTHQYSDYFGYRHRGVALESARGVTQCSTGQWSRLTQPSQVEILALHIEAKTKHIVIHLTGRAGKYTLNQTHFVNREND